MTNDDKGGRCSLAVALLLMDAPPNSLFSDLITDFNYQPLIQGVSLDPRLCVQGCRTQGNSITTNTMFTLAKLYYTKYLPELSSTPYHGTLDHWSRLNGFRRCARDCRSRRSKLCSRAQHTSVSALYTSQLLKAMGRVTRCCSI